MSTWMIFLMAALTIFSVYRTWNKEGIRYNVADAVFGIRAISLARVHPSCRASTLVLPCRYEPCPIPFRFE